MLMINILGALLIAAIIYWFWLYKPEQTQSDDNKVKVVVNNGVYQPGHIKVVANKEVELTFDRQDSAPCAEMVIFPQLDISKTLVIGDGNTIKLPALEAGEYDFHCQMQMYKGKLIAQ
ncbi:cupredoxin domain-containing protein [Pseudoalteromonas sp. Z9A5]|uniref:cupredoxin domain-containing protein n=1 Tax=Pseudoalteromonas sp. Z9A5 TaxID=2686355 RepID=UPI00140A198E|nr:cupredoxin domain-containing protein [Pseudoalteromonas sp. Z9A5]